MEIGSILPQHFFPFLGGTSFNGGNNAAIYQLGAQQTIQNKETALKQNSTARLYLDARQLFSRANTLLPTSWNTVFNARAASDSIPRAAEYSPANSANPTNFNVQVSQPAGSQPVRTDSLTANKSMKLPRSYYEFAIDTGLETFKFRVETNQTDTYREVMQKVADSINNADVGLSAKIVDNYAAPSSYIELQGIPRSAMSSVTIMDTSGDLMERLGSSTTQYSDGAAQGGLENAVSFSKFSINGKMMYGVSNSAAIYENTGIYPTKQINAMDTPAEIYDAWIANGKELMDMASQSANNNVAIMGDYQGQLQISGANSNDSNISVRPDEKQISQAVSKFFDAFNQLNESLGNAGAYGFSEARSFLTGVMSSNLATLSSLGIENNGNGFQVDRSKLESQVRTGIEDVKEIFGGANGIASKTIFGIEKVLYAPMFNLTVFTKNVGATTKLDIAGLLKDISS